MNKKILFLGDSDSYIEKIFIKNNQNVVSIYKKNKFIKKYICKLHFCFDLPKTDVWYGFKSIDLLKYSIIIIFDCLYPVQLIKYIRKRNNKSRIVYWLWDSLQTLKGGRIYNPLKEISKLNKLKNDEKYKCEIWSFDKSDCAKYGFYYNNQVIGVFPITVNKIEWDLIYIGRYKLNRDFVLEKIGDELNKFNIKYKFILVLKTKNEKIMENKTKNLSCTKKEFKYSEILNWISKSKVILELVDEKQNGITWKPLEAMFYKKKLITNFKAIKEYDFYNKENVFIIGEDDWKGLNEFINTPYKDISKTIKEKYKIDGWINNFTKYIED